MSSSETVPANRAIFRSTRKSAGLLAPVFALRHARDLGIGDTKAVRDAIDFCAGHDLAVLQILPIHETLGDHSPYNPISARALSPALLHLPRRKFRGLTEDLPNELAPDSSMKELRRGKVQHGVVHALKLRLLWAAYENFEKSADPLMRQSFQAFEEENESWLPAYSLFRVLADHYGGSPNWPAWHPAHRTRRSAEAWVAENDQLPLSARRRASAFIQWVAFLQWTAVRQQAEERGVALMGEMSFGVSRRLYVPMEWRGRARRIRHAHGTRDSRAHRWTLTALCPGTG